MEDREIIQLFFDRDERAIAESRDKYGKYCDGIAAGILHTREDRRNASAIPGCVRGRPFRRRIRPRSRRTLGGCAVALPLIAIDTCVAASAAGTWSAC